MERRRRCHPERRRVAPESKDEHRLLLQTEESNDHLDRMAGSLQRVFLPALFSLEGTNVPAIRRLVRSIARARVASRSLKTV